MGLGISRIEREHISKIFPAKWKEKGIMYCGVKASASMLGDDLLENNIMPMVNWVQSQLEKWLQLSL